MKTHNTLLQNDLLRLLKSGKTKKEIDRAIHNLFERYVVPVEFREKILKDMNAQYDWISDKVMSQEERSLIAKELHRYQGWYAKAGGKIQDDVRFIVGRGLLRDEDSKTMRNKLIDRLGVLNYHAETIVRTAKIGFAGIDFVHQAQDAGVEYFTYTGPPGERAFCQAHLGKTYHISEIEKMNNGMGLPVLVYCGGFRCRHRWRRATAAEIAAMGDNVIVDEIESDSATKLVENTADKFFTPELLADINKKGYKHKVIHSQISGSPSTYLNVTKEINGQEFSIFKYRLSNHMTTDKWAWRDKTHETITNIKYSKEVEDKVHELYSEYQRLSQERKKLDMSKVDNRGQLMQDNDKRRQEIKDEAQRVKNSSRSYVIKNSDVETVRSELKLILNKKLDSYDEITEHVDELKKEIEHSKPKEVVEYNLALNELKKLNGSEQQLRDKMNSARKKNNKKLAAELESELGRLGEKNKEAIEELRKKINKLAGNIHLDELIW